MSVKRNNVEKKLDLADGHVDALLVERVRDYPIQESTLVLNPTTSTAYVGESPKTRITPMSSTTLMGTRIESAESLILIQLRDENDIGGIVHDTGWRYNADIPHDDGDCGCTFPRDVPLWRGPQEDVGVVSFDPCTLMGKEEKGDNRRNFLAKVNLWFAPAGTDCSIHKKHEFVEIHSQVSGLGHMQKFREPDRVYMYENLPMGPGSTTLIPFCWHGDDDAFLYPWHQYYADTDCVWLAVEYHATTLT